MNFELRAMGNLPSRAMGNPYRYAFKMQRFLRLPTEKPSATTDLLVEREYGGRILVGSVGGAAHTTYKIHSNLYSISKFTGSVSCPVPRH